MENDNKKIHKKKKSDRVKSNIWTIDPAWIYIFFVLLIGNLIFGFWMLWNIDFGRHMDEGSIVAIPLIGIVALFDLIAVISYRVTHHP